MNQNNPMEQVANLLSEVSCYKSGEQLSILANFIAILLSKGKTSDEINVLGNFIVGVGGLILTIAAQQSSCESKQNKMKQIADLQKQIKDLEADL